MLLDMQSTEDLFCNNKLIAKIWETNQLLTVQQGKKKLTTNKKAYLQGYGEVWFHEAADTNRICFKNIINKNWRITYDSADTHTFVVHKPDGQQRRFAMHKNGLHYLEPTKPSRRQNKEDNKTQDSQTTSKPFHELKKHTGDDRVAKTRRPYIIEWSTSSNSSEHQETSSDVRGSTQSAGSGQQDHNNKDQKLAGNENDSKGDSTITEMYENSADTDPNFNTVSVAELTRKSDDPRVGDTMDAPHAEPFIMNAVTLHEQVTTAPTLSTTGVDNEDSGIFTAEHGNKTSKYFITKDDQNNIDPYSFITGVRTTRKLFEPNPFSSDHMPGTVEQLAYDGSDRSSSAVMHKPDGQEFITRRDTIFTENTYEYFKNISKTNHDTNDDNTDYQHDDCMHCDDLSPATTGVEHSDHKNTLKTCLFSSNRVVARPAGELTESRSLTPLGALHATFFCFCSTDSRHLGRLDSRR